jgi:hypothetical protein
MLDKNQLCALLTSPSTFIDAETQYLMEGCWLLGLKERDGLGLVWWSWVFLWSDMPTRNPSISDHELECHVLTVAGRHSPSTIREVPS